MALRTAEDVFVDYCGRRRGILRALTTDVEAFFVKCSPDRENLCLYGQSDGSWEVALPCEEVPPELPEPTLGVNFARDGMKRADWLALVAVHSDSWLMAVAFFNGARLDQEARRQLFNDINSLPTCFEIVSGRATAVPVPPRTAGVKRQSFGGGGGAPVAALDKRPRPAEGPPARRVMDEDDEGDDDEGDDGGGGGSEPCPNCGRKYRSGEFWIACDFCDRWYDGKCVGMTQQKADRQPHWQCPRCVANRARAGQQSAP